MPIYYGSQKVKPSGIKNAYYGSTKVYSAVRLPAEYQEVQYIQSSGTQWINTGVKPYNLETTIDFQYVTITYNTDNWIIGTYCGSNERYYMLDANANANAGNMSYYDTTGDITYRYTTVRSECYNRHKIVFNEYNTHNVIFDDVIVGNNVAPVISTSLNDIYIFRFWNGSSTPINPASAKLYSLQMKEAGVLIRDFIPCYRIADSVIGLYDTVNDQFYTNAGTGTFTKGANV